MGLWNWILRIGIPPELGADVVEGVNDLLIIVNGGLGFLAVPTKLGLKLARPMDTSFGEVGLDSDEELSVSALGRIGAVFWDGDLDVWAEVGGDLVQPQFDPYMVHCRSNKAEQEHQS